jgi:hypothetical protein
MRLLGCRFCLSRGRGGRHLEGLGRRCLLGLFGLLGGGLSGGFSVVVCSSQSVDSQEAVAAGVGKGRAQGLPVITATTFCLKRDREIAVDRFAAGVEEGGAQNGYVFPEGVKRLAVAEAVAGSGLTSSESASERCVGAVVAFAVFFGAEVFSLESSKSSGKLLEGIHASG